MSLKKCNALLKLNAKHLLRSGFIIKPFVKKVEKYFQMSGIDLEHIKEQRFIAIFRDAYDKSPFYHRIYTEAGIKREDIQSLQDLQKLPVITKDMVRQHAKEMLTVPQWKVLNAHTSGTTGTPLSLYEDWKSILMEQAYHICARKRAGYKSGQSFVSLRGHLDKSITHLFVRAQNTLYLSSYNINARNFELYYTLLRKHKPKAIEGYPSSLYSLALLLKDNNLTLNIPVAFTSSETLLPYQRELIQEVFHTEIFDLYGMTERTICLMENLNHDGYYEMPGYSINEYLEDGEICTSLINKSFPLIRYRSNDIIEIEKEGSSQAKIKGIQGRMDDAIICKDGTRITRLGFLVKDVPGIRYTQLYQSKIGQLEVRIVINEDYNSASEEKLIKNLNDRIGQESMDIFVKPIEEKDLVFSQRGKFKYIISNINNSQTLN